MLYVYFFLFILFLVAMFFMAPDKQKSWRGEQRPAAPRSSRLSDFGSGCPR